MNGEGMLLIISGPSGSGKGTVVEKLCKKECYALSISYTTREVRCGEVDGVNYFYCSNTKFDEMIKNGELLEFATFRGNFYGTGKTYVAEQIKKGKVVVLEIEVNGALQVKKKFPEAVLVFMMPQNIHELERRLITRGRENREEINGRLSRAREEVLLVDSYDYIVVNEKVETSVNEIDSIVQVELLKSFRNRHKAIQFLGDDNNA